MAVSIAVHEILIHQPVLRMVDGAIVSLQFVSLHLSQPTVYAITIYMYVVDMVISGWNQLPGSAWAKLG